MTKKKILFFTPSAGRTGSEMALWNTLRYAAPSKFDMALSSYVDGALLKLLPLHIPTFRSFYGSLKTAPLRRISDSLVAFLIIACSEAVRRVLRTLGRTERIEVCYPPVDIESLKRTGSGRLKVRHSLGIPDTAFTWVMSGF